MKWFLVSIFRLGLDHILKQKLRVFEWRRNPFPDLHGFNKTSGLLLFCMLETRRICSQICFLFEEAGSVFSFKLFQHDCQLTLCRTREPCLHHTEKQITKILHHQSIIGFHWPMAGPNWAYAPRLSILKWFFIASFIYPCLNVLCLSPLASYVNMLQRRWH